MEKLIFYFTRFRKINDKFFVIIYSFREEIKF